MIAFLILLENILAVSAQLALRRGAQRFADAPLGPSILLEPLRNPYIMSGLLLHGLSFFLYIFVLSKLRLNVLYPVATGLSIVLITVVSVVLLGERLTAAQAAGIAAITSGIALVFTA
jgi:multidrug transporter EmrE-like cation transporter